MIHTSDAPCSLYYQAQNLRLWGLTTRLRLRLRLWGLITRLRLRLRLWALTTRLPSPIGTSVTASECGALCPTSSDPAYNVVSECIDIQHKLTCQCPSLLTHSSHCNQPCSLALPGDPLQSSNFHHQEAIRPRLLRSPSQGLELCTLYYQARTSTVSLNFHLNFLNFHRESGKAVILK